MIQKTLEKKIQQKQAIFDSIESISEVKLLLNKDSMDDIEIINNAFPQSTNRIVLQTNAESKITENLSKKYDGKVYERHQIKEICMMYKLKFLPSTLYKAIIPIEVIHELKTVSKKEGLLHIAKGTEMIYERNLFIMAPAKMFNIESTYKKRIDKLAEAKKLKQMDPALFIKIDDNRFLFIKEWGNSFTPIRRVLGFLTATKKRLNTIFFLLWLTCAIGLTIGANLIMQNSNTEKNIWHFLILSMYIAICIVILISWMLSANAGFFLAKYKSEDKSFWKVDEEYATEKNWMSK